MSAHKDSEPDSREELSLVLRPALENLASNVFEVFTSVEDLYIDVYDPKTAEGLPERDQVASDFCDELEAGKVEGFEAIDQDPDFARAARLLSRRCSEDPKELITKFLRHLLQELAQLYGEIDFDASRPRYERSMSFRADTFEAQLALLSDFCCGNSIKRVEASLGGLAQSADFDGPATIQLSDDLALELRGLHATDAGTSIGLVRRIPLVENADSTSEQHFNSSDRNVFERTLTLMRVYWGLHITIDEVIERPPFNAPEYRVRQHFFHTYPHYSKVTWVDPLKLQRFARFLEIAGTSPSWSALDISVDRLQRHLFTQEAMRSIPRHVDRLIDLVIACDALLGEGGGEAVRKLGLRFACLMRLIVGADPRTVYNLVAASYKKRSDIVHGVTGTEEMPYPLDLEDAVRVVTGVLLLSRNTARKRLLSELDALVLEGLKGNIGIDDEKFPTLANLIKMRDFLPIYPNSGEIIESKT